MAALPGLPPRTADLRLGRQQDDWYPRQERFRGALLPSQDRLLRERNPCPERLSQGSPHPPILGPEPTLLRIPICIRLGRNERNWLVHNHLKHLLCNLLPPWPGCLRGRGFGCGISALHRDDQRDGIGTIASRGLGAKPHRRPLHHDL